MTRYSLIITLMLCTGANAGAVISLVPTLPGPYVPGQVINIDVMAQLTPGTPSIPGPAGTTTTIRLHSMQLDFTDSTPELEINAVSHHTGV